MPQDNKRARTTASVVSPAVTELPAEPDSSFVKDEISPKVKCKKNFARDKN